MQGLMQNQQLLISNLIEFAARHHSDAQIVSRRVEGDIHRYTYQDLCGRAKQLANTLGQLALDAQATQAQQLAQHCAEGEPIFASTAYQLWLLDVSHYLYQQSGDGGQDGNG